MRTVCLNMRRTDNVGDLACNPGLYYNLGEVRCLTDPGPIDHDTHVILGGGGLFHENFDRHIRPIVESAGAVVVWGVGCNSHGAISRFYPDWLSKCVWLGLRDWPIARLPGNEPEWVPCPSCKHPLLAENYPFAASAVVFEHVTEKNLPDHIKAGLPLMTNDAPVEAVIPFLGGAEVVVTNSYHGAYWATLLGKRVIVYPFSSRFYYLMHEPVIADPTSDDDLSDLIGRTRTWPNALSECVEANDRFAEDLMQ